VEVLVLSREAILFGEHCAARGAIKQSPQMTPSTQSKQEFKEELAKIN